MWLDLKKEVWCLLKIFTNTVETVKRNDFFNIKDQSPTSTISPASIPRQFWTWPEDISRTYPLLSFYIILALSISSTDLPLITTDNCPTLKDSSFWDISHQ